MTDLDTLIAAVEAGALPTYPVSCRAVGEPNAVQAREAYGGSLDAAKRLHDALLPGWIWNVVDSETTVWPGFPSNPKDYQNGYCDGNPARAWLLAILRAVKAKGGE